MTPAAPRDADRSRVYAAEAHAFTDTRVDVQIGIEAVAALGGVLFAHPWWRAAVPGVQPVVRSGRSGARSSRAVVDPAGAWQIRLAATHLDAGTLAHEAAHVLHGTHAHGCVRRFGAGGALAHGPAFRAAHLDVSEVLLGPHGRGLLAEAYRHARLAVTPSPPPWPAPPPSADEPHGLLGRWLAAIPLGAAPHR